MRILGIDQSLTATGIAVIEDGKFDILEVVKSRSKGPDRLEEISRRVLELALACDAVAIEQPTYSQRNSAATGALFGLFQLLHQDLWRIGKEPLVINSNHRATYATGNGGAKKAEVIATAARRYGDPRLIDDNIIDAALLAAMTARIFGEPLIEEAGVLPEANIDVLPKVPLPGIYEDLVGEEQAEDRAWRAIAQRKGITRPQVQALRDLDGANPEYANALIDFALERGYEIFQNQQWVTCTRRLDAPQHSCGAKKCSTEWATPEHWQNTVLLRSLDGERWAILSQDEADYGLPAPRGGSFRAHLHTTADELALAAS